MEYQSWTNLTSARGQRLQWRHHASHTQAPDQFVYSTLTYPIQGKARGRESRWREGRPSPLAAKGCNLPEGTPCSTPSTDGFGGTNPNWGSTWWQDAGWWSAPGGQQGGQPFAERTDLPAAEIPQRAFRGKEHRSYYSPPAPAVRQSFQEPDIVDDVQIFLAGMSSHNLLARDRSQSNLTLANMLEQSASHGFQHECATRWLKWALEPVSDPLVPRHLQPQDAMFALLMVEALDHIGPTFRDADRQRALDLLRAGHGPISSSSSFTLYEIAVASNSAPPKIHFLEVSAQEALLARVRDNTLSIDMACRLARCGAHGLCTSGPHRSTPLHCLCDMISSDANMRSSMTSASHATQLQLLGWFIDRWPLALLMKCDGVRKWPASFYAAVFASHFAVRKGPASIFPNHTKQGFMLMVKGLARCVDLFPAKMQVLFQDQEFESMVSCLESACRSCEAISTVRDVEILRLARHTAIPDLEFMQVSEIQNHRAVAELHDRMQRVTALQGLLGLSESSAKKLEESELRAKLAEATALLEKQRLETREELQRLEKELAAEKKQREEHEEEIKTLRTMASARKSNEQTTGALACGQKVSIDLSTTFEHAVGSGVAGASGAADVINKVRQKRLVDVDTQARLPADLLEGVQSIQQSLCRAVERLAKDLYASDAHALHELLQNADDCSYLSDQVPTIQFWLGEKHGSAFFAAESNEAGLTEADVWALCDINASTKTETNSAGGSSIGKKGIGWKSVFLLSDSPYVLSHGYAFKFDIAGPLGLLGYVTPTMLTVDEIQALPEQVLTGWQSGRTVFYMPLRDDESRLTLETELRQLCLSYDDPKSFPAPLPMSLLFLRKLRHLSIRIQSSDACCVSYSRSADARHSCYVTLRKCLKVDKSNIENELEHMFFIHTTPTLRGDLQLAFLLPSDQQQSSLHLDVPANCGTRVLDESVETDMPHGWIFTFLPVRCVGFRFALHAPFELTASRGDLHYDSAHNLHLRNAIPIAFEAAISAEAEAAAYSARQPFLSQAVLPLLASDVADGWWRSPLDAALARVTVDLACVPVEPSGMARLTECLQRGPRGSKARRLADCLPPHLLQQYCGLRFVRENVGTPAAISPDLLARLGCAKFGLHEALCCLRAGWAGHVWFSFDQESDLAEFYNALCEFLLHELLHVHRSVGAGAGTESISKRVSYESVSSVLEAIRRVPLFPILGGQIFTLKSGRLFRELCRGLPNEWQMPLAEGGILHVLHPDLFRKCGDQTLTSLLDALHIAGPSLADVAEQVLEHHAMPVVTTPSESESVYSENHCFDVHLWAAGLACLREFWASKTPIPESPATVVLQHLWPKLHQALRIPDESCLLRPTRQLACRSVLGFSCPLPPDVVQQIEALVGASLPAELRCRIHPEVTSSLYLNPKLDELVAKVEYEAFLHSVGVHGLDLGSKESDVVCLQLSKHFGSGEFWSGLLACPLAAGYVKKCLTSSPDVHTQVLQNLLNTENISTEELFLKDVFLKHGGRFLAYLDIDWAMAKTIEAKDDVLASLAQIEGLSVEVNGKTLMKVWMALARPRSASESGNQCEACEVYADLFAQIIEKTTPQDRPNLWKRNFRGTFSGIEKPIFGPVFVPGAGFKHLSQCIWEKHKDASVMSLAGVVALDTVYGRFGDVQREFFLSVAEIAEKLDVTHCVSAIRSLLEHIDAATALIAMGVKSAHGTSCGAPSGGWAVERPLELPNRACVLAKDIYMQLVGALNASKVKAQAKRTRTTPLPAMMAEKLHSEMPHTGAPMCFIERWFTREFEGVPLELKEKLENCPEFEVIEKCAGNVWVYRSHPAVDSFGRGWELLRCCFSDERLIIVPGRSRQLLGGSAVPTFKYLRSCDAYWDVSPSLQNCQCVAWALSRHYPAELKEFFSGLGVLMELSTEELSRRLAETAEVVSSAAAAAGANTDATISWHSEGYDVGDFIGREDDAALLQAFQEATSRGSGDGQHQDSVFAATTERFLQEHSVVGSGTAGVVERILDSMTRFEQASVVGDSIALEIDDDADGNSAVFHQPAQLDTAASFQNLHRSGEVVGIALWSATSEPVRLIGATRTHAEHCATMLRTVAAEVFEIPTAVINLVSAPNRGTHCFGAFSAQLEGALFIQLPREGEDDLCPSYEWAKAQIAHQLAHAAGHRESCNRRFCSLVERLLVAWPRTQGVPQRAE